MHFESLSFNSSVAYEQIVVAPDDLIQLLISVICSWYLGEAGS